MNYLESNLETLRDVLPKLYGRVRGALASHVLPPLSVTRDGYCNVRVSTAGDGCQPLYPDELKPVLRQLQEQVQSQATNPQIVFWLGLGLGYHLAAFLEKPPSLTRYIVVLEPSMEMFLLYLSVADRRGTLSRQNMVWMVGWTPAELPSAMGAVWGLPDFCEALENRLIVEWGHELRGMADTKSALLTMLDEVARYRMIIPIDGYYGFTHVVDNWNELKTHTSLQSWAGWFRHMPGVIVSSGPSLKHSLNWLREIQGRAVIYCADSSLRVLQQHGITPHFVGCLERIRFMSHHFKNVDTSQTILIAPPLLHRSVFETYQGPKMLMLRSNDLVRWINPALRLDEGHMTSVAHIGLSALSTMGCHPLYLIGQDLYFDPHSFRSHHGECPVDTGRDELEKMGVGLVAARTHQGKEVKTLWAWHLFGEQITALIKQKGIECYNVIPEDFGIRIDAAVRMDPPEAHQRLASGGANVLPRWEDLLRSLETARSNIVPDSMDATLMEIRDWLGEVIRDSCQIVSQIYLFYESVPPSTTSADVYRAFFNKLEELPKHIMDHPLWESLFQYLTYGRQVKIARSSYALLAEDHRTPETIRAKLCMALNWFQEVIVRARQALHQIERLPREVEEVVCGKEKLKETMTAVGDGVTP